MAAKAEMNRIGWLAASLTTHRQRVLDLLARVADIGGLRFERPALFQKFFNLMEQVAIEKQQEMNLLSEIEAIERKHRFNRQSGILKRPDPARKFDPATSNDNRLACEWDEDEDEEYENYCRKYGLDRQDYLAAGNRVQPVLGPVDLPRAQGNGFLRSDYVAALGTPNLASRNRRPRRSLLWLAALWLLLGQSGPKKNQSLNPD